MVRVVAFDVNETLFSLERLGPAFAEAGFDPAAVPTWFARVLRDGFCLAAVDGFATFHDIAREQLRALAAPSLVDDAAVEAVWTAFHELSPYPDAQAALEHLRSSGVRAVTLTNGGEEWIARLLDRAGLAGYIDRNLSVDLVGRWKPNPAVYRLAAEATGVAPHNVALVSAHAHDCHGARRAGLRSGRVNRRRVPQPPYFEPADVEDDDLLGVVRALTIDR